MRWISATFFAASLLSFPALSNERTFALTGAPFQPDASGLGEVTLKWSAPAASVTEVRVGSATGSLFCQGEATGSAQTGHWVRDGMRFFLEDLSFGEPGIVLATLTIHAGVAGPDLVHYVATSADPGYWPTRLGHSSILLFDRDTTDLLGNVYFPDLAFPAAASPDGATLYVGVAGFQPGIAAVDVASATTTAFAPLPGPTNSAVWAEGSGGVSRLLATIASTSRIAVIDPANNFATTWLNCPGPTHSLKYNRFNRSTYGVMDNRPDLCLITPDFQVGLPLPTPLSPTESPFGVLVLDNGESGMLLVTTWSGANYYNYAIDLRDSGVRSFPVQALDAAIPARITSADARSFYVEPSGASILRRYEWSFAPDGTPVFSVRASAALVGRSPTVADDRFIYVPVPGYLNTREGLLWFGYVGFRIVDAMTLEPTAHDGSVIMADPFRDSVLGTYVLEPLVTGAFHSANGLLSPLPPRTPVHHPVTSPGAHPGPPRNGTQ